MSEDLFGKQFLWVENKSTYNSVKIIKRQGNVAGFRFFLIRFRYAKSERDRNCHRSYRVDLSFGWDFLSIIVAVRLFLAYYENNQPNWTFWSNLTEVYILEVECHYTVHFNSVCPSIECHNTLAFSKCQINPKVTSVTQPEEGRKFSINFFLSPIIFRQQFGNILTKQSDVPLNATTENKTHFPDGSASSFARCTPTIYIATTTLIDSSHKL